MSFGKIIFLSITIFSFSIHSGHTTIPIEVRQEGLKKNNPPYCRYEDLNQPMFEYKMLGEPLVLPRKDVEKCMNISLLISPVILVDLMAVVFLKKIKIALNSKLLIGSGLLGFNFLTYTEIKKFRHEAGAWLKALQEKESSLKNEK